MMQKKKICQISVTAVDISLKTTNMDLMMTLDSKSVTVSALPKFVPIYLAYLEIFQWIIGKLWDVGGIGTCFVMFCQ